ncbi:uncharacterized protein LOC105833696 [Monomorium pharaonis]|uniref:uncharacterized protein LOC105833696 n=1 Tax=Monomorium pharaonis TaxID=307658 RepID=UPI00063FC735|nr:uncharacterized protein LOC105833696 [Monomorium pharaonis]
MDNLEQQSTNDIDTTSAIDFLSLYSAIQHDYERTHISNIIIQLLQKYQPKNDINAYKHVLREVYDLLEDYGFQNKQQLLSMIPSPNNISDHTIKGMFRTVTGFTKLNLLENSSNMFQSIFDIKNMDRKMDSISSPKQSFMYDKNESDFKSFSEAFSFRGFSKSEISMIPSHIRNADLSNHHLNDNSKNWLERNNKYQMSFYQQYLLNKKYCPPAKINLCNTIGESHLCHSSRTEYQDICMKMCNNVDSIANIADSRQNKIPPKFVNNVKCEYKKYMFDKDKKSSMSHKIIDVDQDATIKQTIKDDIYKMDVCWTEDQDVIINTDDLLPTAHNKLKTSLNNFLKRAQEGIFVELSIFPRIRTYPQVESLNKMYFPSKNLKPGTPQKVLRQDLSCNVSNSDNNSCLLLKRQNTDNTQKNPREFVETKQKVITYDNKLQKKFSSQEFNKITELQLQQNNLNYKMKKKVATLEYKEKNVKNSKHGCEIVESKSNNVNSEDNFQARSMVQLATYKKRYYDTLLNVQRAKVAISNSLMSSSDHLTAYDDPHYSNYMCHQQHLLHQRHLITRPQFSMYPVNLSGLSSVYCNQYSWTRSICKYLLLKQLKLQRQTSPLYASNQR